MDRQLEEIHMLQCSLLDGEIMLFDDEDDEGGWEAMLRTYAETGHVEDRTPTPCTPCRFTVKLDVCDTRIHVYLPSAYPNSRPVISVRGDRLSKASQERWNETIRSALEETYENATDCPVYELVSTRLLPLLHEEAIEMKELALENPQGEGGSSRVNTRHHALLTSHHLISPTKRRSMQRWTSELTLTGFAKVGYPGVIYCEGEKESVEDFVAKVKAMQWLALRVRFVEELEEESDGITDGKDRKNEKQWVELEKVGEVVQYMRDIGRESYVLDVGLGAGANA